MTYPAPEFKDAALEAAGLWCARLAAGRMSAAQRAQFDAWIAEPGSRVAFERAASAWQAFDEAATMPEIVTLRAEALESLRRANRGRWARSFVGQRGAALWIAAAL